jgi:pimeloyl-ACP methyl ester carboxylesterase
MMSSRAAARLPVVLLHGLIGALDDSRLLAALEPRRRVAPDLLGYGHLRTVPADRIDLAAQVAELGRSLDEAGVEVAHLVGHSVGGAVAMLFTAAHPERVASIVNVEGNFSLKDAFWSANFARLEPTEAEQLLAAEGADPAAWLTNAAVTVDPHTLALATRWLDFQPAATVQAMAASVVKVTGAPAYADTLRSVFRRIPVHLVSGELSHPGWDVPAWAIDTAATLTILPGGHLMMADHSELFARTIDELISKSDHRPARNM